MKSVFIVYQCESYDEELLVSVHATLESAKSKQQMLYAYIFQNDDVAEEDYDGTFEIKCHELHE